MSATRNISHQLVDELQRKLARRGVTMTRSQIWETVKDNPYAVDAIQAGQSAYADGQHSYFRDLALVAFGDSLQQHRIDQGRGYPGMMAPAVSALPSFGQSNDIRTARQRLATTQYERRDITSTGWVPASGTPMHISELAATSARNRGVMESILPVRPLPEAGNVVEVPKFTSNAAVGVQSAELGAPAETDPSTSKASTPVALEAGLLNTAGITALAITNGTPTPATNLASIGRLVATTATAYGEPVDTILVHPRRWAYLQFKLASDLGSLASFVQVASLPTNLGTSEDCVIALARSETPLLVSRVEFQAMPQVLSGSLAVRFSLRRYVALMGSRKPASIGKATGSEFINPAAW